MCCSVDLHTKCIPVFIQLSRFTFLFVCSCLTQFILIYIYTEYNNFVASCETVALTGFFLGSPKNHKSYNISMIRAAILQLHSSYIYFPGAFGMQLVVFIFDCPIVVYRQVRCSCIYDEQINKFTNNK